MQGRLERLYEALETSELTLEIMPFDEVWQYVISKDAIEPSVL